VILKLNRLTKIFNYFVSSLIIISSTLVFFQVSLPLFDLNITEVDKKKVIGMKTSVPIEFDGELEFWWLLKPETTLNFANVSDEKINGKIVLELADNPCKFEESLKVVTETETQKISVIPNISTKISLPLEINPRSSEPVEIVFENMEKCLVKNGDPRDFGAKLINWKYE
jgi:hypothetical protein